MNKNHLNPRLQKGGGRGGWRRKEGTEKDAQRKKREGKLVAIKLIVQKFISGQQSGTGGERR
jgi:hypothetical protein